MPTPKEATRDPVDLTLVRLFQYHVIEQCETVLRAMARIRSNPEAPDVWADLQSVVLAAGNLSRLLWGQSASARASRRPLRESIGVGDESTLRLRGMRNHFEHIDERLDEWWRDSAQHYYADRNIGPRTEMLSGLQDVERFRHFEPDTGTLWFWGDRLELEAIESEVARIYPRVTAEAAKPDR